MGLLVTIGGDTFEATDYSVEEASTPLAAGDTSGSVGTFNVSVPYLGVASQAEFDNLPLDVRTRINPTLALYGPDFYIGQPITLSDSRYGFTIGTVDSTTVAPGSATFSCLSRLGDLQVYGVQAGPFIGRLDDAFYYYCSLAGASANVLVDPAIASKQVLFPGFHGELWARMKQMAAAVDADIALIAGYIILRPIREREVNLAQRTTSGKQGGGTALAQSVELYHYASTAITDSLVYPPGGWTLETPILNVNAGETAEYTLELESSLSSFVEPVMQYALIGPGDNNISAYNIVGDDGLRIQPAMWINGGGRIEFELNPDTTSITVRITGALNIPTTSGNEQSQSFSIAAASSASGNRYSTLRILGTGISYVRTKKTIRTGVTADQTGTEVGVTIDNPFLTDLNTLYRAGVRAAKAFSGYDPSLTGSLAGLDITGGAQGFSDPRIGDVYTAVQETVDPPTFGGLSDLYDAEGVVTLQDEIDFWGDYFSVDTTQPLGNVAGARLWDRFTRRWYRTRTATIPPGVVSVTAEDDLTVGDRKQFYDGMTYDDMKDAYGDVTNGQLDRIGLLK